LGKIKEVGGLVIAIKMVKKIAYWDNVENVIRDRETDEPIAENDFDKYGNIL